ncbi:unnamed protein product [Closterium sp. NIES-64]|nr:unnamed protein product [Closterium sp. NIES-64]
MNPLLSVLLSALISSLFVLSLYVWEVPRILRGAPPANRDDPRVVCQRITSVLGSCVASAAIVAAVAKFGLLDDTHAPLPSVPRLLSLQPDHLAPLSEEFVFRAALCPLLLAGGFSVTSTIFICPLFFSLAHGHHIWNLMHYHRCSLPQALAMVGFQMAFTWVFGCLAAFTVLRTGSLWASVAAHAFCNAMGVPDFQGALTHRHRYGESIEAAQVG